MKLKIYIPDWNENAAKLDCTPMVYPFLNTGLSFDENVIKYGDWIKDVMFVNDLPSCDICLLMYNLNYYYRKKKVSELAAINRQTVNASKLLICLAKGDIGITPNFKNFHLYRWDAYASKNEGNQFVMPVLIGDPLKQYYNNEMTIHETKTEKPVIGFCGQGQGGIVKLLIDTIRGIENRVLKVFGKWPNDTEPLISTTYIRSKMLNKLENSPLVSTKFIRHAKYRGGVKTKEEKEESSKQFFKNIIDTQYTFCYRGVGNFSVRLFETLACGRIPIIVKSDNNLPLEKDIDWQKFPTVNEDEFKKIDVVIAKFHKSISEADFVALQKHAREIWENYLTYKSFMRNRIDYYLNT